MATSVLSGTIIATSFIHRELAYSFMAIGCFAGILLSPDLDVDNGNISNYLLKRIASPIEMLWRIYWYPYRVKLKHRSFWSHFPVFSTLLRVVYFFFIPILLSIYYSYFDLYYFFLWFVFGLILADFLHYLMDIV